jgi:nucleotide-binding universal stress UspA family protein
MLYGSVADQILRRTTVPVLLVPSIAEHTWPTDGPLSLLIPLDGSDLAAEALQSAELLTDAFGAKVTLLRVVQPLVYPLYGEGYAYIPYDEDAEIAEAQQYLDDEAVHLGDLGLRIDTTVKLGDPARVIGEVARERDVDAIVMATHGSGGLSRLILGSVATGTLRHTTAPLLLVRPTATGAAESPGGRASSDASTSNEEAVREQNVTVSGDPTLSVHLHASELELIEHSLQALGHAPGYNDAAVRAARNLAGRLRASDGIETSEPVTSH